MGKRTLEHIEENVLQILLEYPDSRGNDFVLYARYIQANKPELNNVGLIYALMAAKQLGMPSYESVTRARRKLQERQPELKAPKDISGKRAEREELFRVYANS